jgi:cyclopropane-fatty-acyl-phospholipid synthase
VRFTTAAAQLAVLHDPELRLGEAYMDGTLIVEQGSIVDLLSLAPSQDGPGRRRHSFRMVSRPGRRLRDHNGRRSARMKVAHHYDLDGRLYSLFLDADRQYSCAYFEAPDQSLEDAQLAKRGHLAAKLLAEPGNGVLDIGAGRGGLALYLAETCGAQVTGITLSTEQLTAARRRAERTR